MKSIIKSGLPYYTFTCETDPDLIIYVQPVAGDLTNLEMYDGENRRVARQATEADASEAFKTFNSYMKWGS